MPLDPFDQLVGRRKRRPLADITRENGRFPQAKKRRESPTFLATPAIYRSLVDYNGTVSKSNAAVWKSFGSVEKADNKAGVLKERGEVSGLSRSKTSKSPSNQLGWKAISQAWRASAQNLDILLEQQQMETTLLESKCGLQIPADQSRSCALKQPRQLQKVSRVSAVGPTLRAVNCGLETLLVTTAREICVGDRIAVVVDPMLSVSGIRVGKLARHVKSGWESGGHL